MDWIKSKAILAGFALMVAAAYDVVSAIADGNAPDFNMAIAKFANGLGIVGIRYRLPRPGADK